METQDESTQVSDALLGRRLRRKATRKGLRLLKSRARDPEAPGYGTYCLIDGYTNTVVQMRDFAGGYGCLLSEIALYLDR